jgi:hypothetical protein
MPRFLSRAARRCGALGLILLAGCSAAPPPLILPEHGENLALILTAYSEAFEKLQRPPNSMDDLRPFLKGHGKSEQVLISPHDGQLYEILWGVDPRQIIMTDAANPHGVVIAHDRVGVNGIRHVATGMGVMRMEEKEFQRIRELMKKR